MESPNATTMAAIVATILATMLATMVATAIAQADPWATTKRARARDRLLASAGRSRAIETLTPGADGVPAARNGPYYGLMQILPATARTMGYKGTPNGLLDAETNLKYAVKYLRGAWLLSNGSYDTAVKWYSQGYYYEAKRRGMLVETGLRPG
mgnify:CR=1 FL=1